VKTEKQLVDILKMRVSSSVLHSKIKMDNISVSMAVAIEHACRDVYNFQINFLFKTKKED